MKGASKDLEPKGVAIALLALVAVVGLPMYAYHSCKSSWEDSKRKTAQEETRKGQEALAKYNAAKEQLKASPPSRLMDATKTIGEAPFDCDLIDMPSNLYKCWWGFSGGTEHRAIYVYTIGQLKGSRVQSVDFPDEK